jgi:hypothetical protein
VEELLGGLAGLLVVALETHLICSCAGGALGPVSDAGTRVRIAPMCDLSAVRDRGARRCPPGVIVLLVSLVA